MEKILQQILEELKDLRQGQDIQGKRLERVEKGQETLGMRLEHLDKGQDLLARQQTTQGRQIEKLHSDLTKLAVHVEGEITDKIRGLYDDREVLRNVITDTLHRIENRQDRHEEQLNMH